MNNLSIVLCTLNEGKNIASAIDKLLIKDTVKEIIIIDDDSQDETIDILNGYKNPKIYFKVRKNTKNFSSAFIDGLYLAKGDYILRFDLDMFNYIDFFIDTFLNIDHRTDCLIFSRYVENGIDKRSNYRSIPSWILNKLCQLLLFKDIKDYTGCIIIIKKKVLKEIFPKKTNYANFIIDFIFDLKRKNKILIEVPFTQDKITEFNSKSGPNIIKFIINGSFYLISILRCFLIKNLKLK
ncbi:glycosyltransferase [Candidatus Pelagibacter communis]|uniref:glycosyltransferase n=1 Tax=Pelagibacter ubique TaxID=198252 RepID=UPI00094C4369|nr:glycosyltransferase [Candidatus Pelagibacter ubique]